MDIEKIKKARAAYAADLARFDLLIGRARVEGAIGACDALVAGEAPPPEPAAEKPE